MLKVKKLIENTSYKFQHIHQCKQCLQKITSQKSERVPNTCINGNLKIHSIQITAKEG